MIDVTYDRTEHTVIVKGHAYSVSAGEDPVCAGVSALTCTLAAAVENMALAGNVIDPVTSLNSGYAKISCASYPNTEAAVILIFDTLCLGYALLAQAYPASVRLFTTADGMERR